MMVVIVWSVVGFNIYTLYMVMEGHVYINPTPEANHIGIRQKPRRVAGFIISFIWMYVSMIRSIQDNFGQNQVLCRENTKICSHHH